MVKLLPFQERKGNLNFRIMLKYEKSSATASPIRSRNVRKLVTVWLNFCDGVRFNPEFDGV